MRFRLVTTSLNNWVSDHSLFYQKINITTNNLTIKYTFYTFTHLKWLRIFCISFRFCEVFKYTNMHGVSVRMYKSFVYVYVINEMLMTCRWWYSIVLISTKRVNRYYIHTNVMLIYTHNRFIYTSTYVNVGLRSW